MRTPKPRAPSEPKTSRAFLMLLGGAALAAMIAAAGACTDSDGVTPTCDDNVDDGGMSLDPNGCAQFATCLDCNGNLAAPAVCCVTNQCDGGPDGSVPFTGNDLASCVYGYGGCTSFAVSTDTSGNMTYMCGGLDGG